MDKDNLFFHETFNNKKVLITGHTGFKGSWLSIWLFLLGAKVFGISNSIPTTPSHFSSCNLQKKLIDIRANICDVKRIREIIQDIQPDFIFHLAAQSLVKVSYQDPFLTWQTNTMGTVSILESLKSIRNKCVAIFITSDKSYDNLEWDWGYRENDKLGGIDPYSASKGSAEFAIRSYSKSFFNNSNIRIGVGRAGNVIGGGDWSKYRLVPDCMKSWAIDQEVIIRNPQSTRPWQHVLEPISGYLILASRLNINEHLKGEAFNFGPPANQNFSVIQVVEEMSKYWNKVKWKIEKDSNSQESDLLKLNCDKALVKLSWEPVWGFNETINQTVKWYKYFYEKKGDLLKISTNQIQNYTNSAILRNLSWTNAQ